MLNYEPLNQQKCALPEDLRLAGVHWLWKHVRRCWAQNRPLTALVVFSFVCLIISITGLEFDARLINGERAWIKPLKFSISFSVYAYTLIYFSQYLTKN